LNELTEGNVADEGFLRAEDDVEAAMAGLVGRYRAQTSAAVTNCQKNRQAFVAGMA